MEPLGFSFNLRLTRSQLADKDLYDQALKERLKEQKALVQKFSKNASKNSLGEIHGRVHVV